MSAPPACRFPDCRCDTAKGLYECETMPAARGYLGRSRDRLLMLFGALMVVGALWLGFLFRAGAL